MKKDIYAVLVATAMLVLIGTESGWAKVRWIIDEYDIAAFTSKSTAVPNGLGKTSSGTYVFSKITEDAILQYNPHSKITIFGQEFDDIAFFSRYISRYAFPCTFSR